MKKLLSVVLTIALIFALSPSIFAFTYETLGESWYAAIDTVYTGVNQKTAYFENRDGKRQAYWVEIAPDSPADIQIAYGSKLIGRDTLSSLIKANTDDKNIAVAGINADFFSLQTGIPMSAVIADGRLITTATGFPVFAICEDESFFGVPDISLVISDANGNSAVTTLFNKYPTQYGAYVLSSDYAESTLTAENSTEIVVHITEGDFKIGTTVTGIVTDVRSGVTNSAVDDDSFVICVSDNFVNKADYDFLEPLQTVKLDITADEKWNKVNTAVGGYNMLLENYLLASDYNAEPSSGSRQPRSAIGKKSDGTIVIFAVDGRTTDSIGLTASELANALLELGCSDAMLFDGGGSTEIAVYKNGEVVILNDPTDGVERQISDAFLVIGDAKDRSLPSRLQINTDFDFAAVGGSCVTLSAKTVDAFGNECKTINHPKITYNVLNSEGYIKDNMFFSGDKRGTAIIEAKCEYQSKELKGYYFINVVDEFDISADDISLYLARGAESAIEFNATYHTFPISLDLGSFVWENTNADTLEDEVPHDVLIGGKTGYLDKKGTFHASSDLDQRIYETFIGTCGKETVKIRVCTGLFPILPLSFDSASEDISLLQNAEWANGRHNGTSYKVSGKDVLPAKAITIDSCVEYVDLWCRCENDSLFCRFTDADKKTVLLPYEKLEDYSLIGGYKHFRAQMPAEIPAPFTLDGLIVSDTDGEFIIDSFEIYCGEGEKSPAFADNADHWSRDYAEKTFDMGLIDGVVEEDSERYFYPDRKMTRAEFAKLLVSYMCLDLDIENETEDGENDGVVISDAIKVSDYDDIAEWAKPYVMSVMRAKFMNGKRKSDGTLVFDPGSTITRQEVMQVFGNIIKSRTLCIDDGSESIFENFDDCLQIADWAKDNVKLVVDCKIVGGYNNKINPTGEISRAEIAVMFANLFEYETR